MTELSVSPGNWRRHTKSALWRRHIVRLFGITKLDRRIRLATTRAEALQALAETEA